MPSEELAFINELLRSASLAAMSLDEQRAAVESGGGSLPTGTSIAEAMVEGLQAEWVTIGTEAPRCTMIALRGGAYSLGSLSSNRRFCALLADTCDARVLNVGYRSAPEHKSPAALDDALHAYRWLLRNGAAPSTVVFAGNSAGGGLALAALLALRDAGDPLPAGAIAISPWTDLALTGASISTNAATEVMLDPIGAGHSALLYADADQLRDPYVSPLYGDPTGLPPLLLQASGSEILLDDATRFAEQATRAGVEVTLEIVEDMPHVWPLFGGMLPEADDALQHIGLWLDKLLD